MTKKMKILMIVLSASLLTSAGCGWWNSNPPSPGKELVSADRAMFLVHRIPEVLAYATRTQQAGSTTRIQSSIYMNPDQCEIEGISSAWYVDVKTHDSQSTRLWNRFRVDAVSEKITVWRTSDDKYIPLSAWEAKIPGGPARQPQSLWRTNVPTG